MNEKLNKIFDLTPVPKEDEIKEPTVISQETSSELNHASQAQHDLLEIGRESLETLIEFAKASESPRAWEVVATLMKVQSDVANSVANIALEKGKVNSSKKDSPTHVTNQAVFVGSTSELQKLLKGNPDETI